MAEIHPLLVTCVESQSHERGLPYHMQYVRAGNSEVIGFINIFIAMVHFLRSEIPLLRIETVLLIAQMKRQKDYKETSYIAVRLLKY